MMIRTRLIIKYLYYVQSLHLWSILCLFCLFLFVCLFSNLFKVQSSPFSSSRKIREERQKGSKIRASTGRGVSSSAALLGSSKKTHLKPVDSWGKIHDRTCLPFFSLITQSWRILCLNIRVTKVNIFKKAMPTLRERGLMVFGAQL